MNRAIIAILAAATLACEALPNAEGDGSGTTALACAAAGWTFCQSNCWPPGTACDTAGRCSLDEPDSCYACPEGGDMPWCLDGHLECCPASRPYLCGAAYCAETPAACDGLAPFPVLGC